MHVWILHFMYCASFVMCLFVFWISICTCEGRLVCLFVTLTVFSFHETYDIIPLTEIYRAIISASNWSQVTHQKAPNLSINIRKELLSPIMLHFKNCFQILHLIFSTNDMYFFLVERHGRTHNLGCCYTLANVVKSDHLGNPKQVELIFFLLFSQGQVTQRVLRTQ